MMGYGCGVYEAGILGLELGVSASFTPKSQKHFPSFLEILFCFL